MLLITRRTGEGIVINDTIEIKILDIRGGRVKLGLEYPPGNTVYREEVFSKIQEENRAAAKVLGPTTQIGTVLASLRKANSKGEKTDDTTNPGPDLGPKNHA